MASSPIVRLAGTSSSHAKLLHGSASPRVLRRVGGTDKTQSASLHRDLRPHSRADPQATPNPSVVKHSRYLSQSPSCHDYLATLKENTGTSYFPRFEQATIPTRRQTLTASESRIIDDMFSSVFYAASRQEQTHKSCGNEVGTPSSWVQNFSTKPQQVQWTRPGDDVLDIKKEEIENCESDQALYDWVCRELFMPLSGRSSSALAINTAQDNSNPTLSPDTITNDSSPSLPAFAYPLLLAIAMRTFRTKYEDPHAALALFAMPRRISTAAYVMCCSTAAYNEYIETKWEAFRDLNGVCEALEEMRLNKVRVDTRTSRLIETLRREIGQRNFWQEEGFGESHSGVVKLLERIEDACWAGMSGCRATTQVSTANKHGAKWKVNTEAWKHHRKGNEDNLEFV
ncbi:hypothetical protein CPB86DRAFT_761636 [Serendipita vermifera]|nr:hypothetical protein CPB86DRAFT_761636 [Serendipita vermifera]